MSKLKCILNPFHTIIQQLEPAALGSVYISKFYEGIEKQQATDNYANYYNDTFEDTSFDTNCRCCFQ